MWFVNFSKSNCKNCYACVRVCPVNAVEVKNEKAQIMKSRCIVCGECSKVCHQNTKLIKSEKKLVQSYFKDNEKVVVSIAPSFAAIYGANSNKIPSALKKLGFEYIEETVVGVDPIIDQYHFYTNKSDDKNYITSFCPSVCNLIQKHYPDLIDNLIPVVSPHICHARMLKQKYGADTKVVFIGPCIAKKTEAYMENSIDSVLTFRELDRWLVDENIKLDELQEEPFDEICVEKRLFPIVGGPTKEIEKKKTKRDILHVDGIKECIETLDAIRDGKFNNVLFEMSSCRHGCLGGSGMPNDCISYHERKVNLKKYSKEILIPKDNDKNKLDNSLLNIAIDKEFKSLYVPLKEPCEEEITKILNNMGKYKKSDELNCGNCGYSTCRKKAVAVYNDMAEISMCLPYMRQKAENLTNVIFDTTPNLIILIDKDLDVIQMNPSAEKFFKVKRGTEKGLPIILFLEEEIFNKVRESKKNIFKEKVTIPQKGATIIQSVIWLEHDQVMLWIADDITKNEELERKHQKMKFDAINMAQKVINKQMTVAQEIASLLGETTAETKVTLTQLKNLIQSEEEIK